MDKLLRIAVSLATVCALPFVSAPGGAQSTDRSVPAEDTAAAVIDPAWRAPRTSWGDPSFEGVWSVDDMLEDRDSIVFFDVNAGR